MEFALPRIYSMSVPFVFLQAAIKYISPKREPSSLDNTDMNRFFSSIGREFCVHL